MESTTEKSFKDLNLKEELINALKKQGITVPTKVQEAVTPCFMNKEDIIVQSETGSGKTLAYLLPMFMMIDEGLRSTQFIILAPTHELAVQVNKQAELLAENSGLNIRSALIIGGANLARQLEKLKYKPQIVVGSTGRILDLIKKKKIYAHTVKAIVLDEGDRMLDELNIDDVKAVIKTTLKERQIAVFSASISDKTVGVCNEIMKEPKVLAVSEKDSMPRNIEHMFITCQRRDKINYIRKIVAGEKVEKAIVFINNQENIEVTVEKLNYHNIKAVGLYGAAYKSERQQAMAAFREGRANVLVASDIGARGLDIPGVTHIINLDIPEEPVYYLHRAGRTGRMNNTGKVISLVTLGEKKWLNKYERVYNIKMIQKDMSYGNIVDISETAVNEPTEKEKTKKEPEIKKEPKKEKPKSKIQAKPKETKKDSRKDSKKDSKENLGFFAKKAEKLAQKEKNRNK